jgi:hypothetical protein
MKKAAPTKITAKFANAKSDIILKNKFAPNCGFLIKFLSSNCNKRKYIP